MSQKISSLSVGFKTEGEPALSTYCLSYEHWRSDSMFPPTTFCEPFLHCVIMRMTSFDELISFYPLEATSVPQSPARCTYCAAFVHTKPGSRLLFLCTLHALKHNGRRIEHAESLRSHHHRRWSLRINVRGGPAACRHSCADIRSGGASLAMVAFSARS